MFTENGLLIDLEEVAKVVDGCDVFTIGFRTFPERLIVDTRETEHVGPLAQVVGPVSSVEERFHWLGRERPEVARMLDEAMTELRRLERTSLQQALSGEGYHSLWPQE